MSEVAIAENLNEILRQIDEAEKKSGRPKGSVKLCAVSKFHPAESVISAMNAGQVLFGENRVQEAYEKFTSLENRNFELHIIGQLQSNKVRKAVEVASCIQSVDRESLLEEIENQSAKINRTMKIFFEVHTGEDSKSGYADRESLYDSARNCAKGLYPHIIPCGLMTMAPFTEDEDLIRKSFATLRKLRDEMNVDFPELPIKELSMGMSGDFKIAIEEGSTMVRVGTAIFGERDYSKK